MTAILVIDVGTTTIRAAVVDEQLQIVALAHRSSPPTTPAPGLVEFDPVAMYDIVTDACQEVLSNVGEPARVLGITNQRASTVVWERSTGEPIAPALGWQDLRTVMECIMAKAEHDLALAPNQPATKVPWLLDHVEGARQRDVCFGTVETWLAWKLSGGELHVTDHTNAAVSGLMTPDASQWDARTLDVLGIPASVLPTVVDSCGVIGAATALDGSVPIGALIGDQQASLVGQGCVTPGRAKLTFGTSGILDLCGGDDAPATARRGPHGTYPVVAWSRQGALTWGVEAIMLAAGTNVEWLRDDLGVLRTSAESADLASSVRSADGAVFVPALLGLGTPAWDYGARGTLLGVTRGTTKAHLVRAVLEGVAHRGADLVEAAEADTGLSISALRVDGGMSANPTFTQAVADATQRRVEVSPVAEATTLGAAFLAGLAVGVWDDVGDADRAWNPARVHEPAQALDRDQWREAVERSRRWIPELSALEF